MIDKPFGLYQYRLYVIILFFNGVCCKMTGNRSFRGHRKEFILYYEMMMRCE